MHSGVGVGLWRKAETRDEKKFKKRDLRVERGSAKKGKNVDLLKVAGKEV